MENAHGPVKVLPAPSFSVTSSKLVPLLLVFLLVLVSVTNPAHSANEHLRIVDEVSIRHVEPGHAYGYTLPVYEVGQVRFVSGGVGVEEREATYPAYSVKLILVQHPHAFLTQVSLLIQDEEGNTVVNIPHDLVSGPWVFIDLPPGRFHIVGENRSGDRIERTIRVKPNTTNVHHLIWPSP